MDRRTHNEGSGHRSRIGLGGVAKRKESKRYAKLNLNIWVCQKKGAKKFLVGGMGHHGLSRGPWHTDCIGSFIDIALSFTTFPLPVTWVPLHRLDSKNQKRNGGNAPLSSFSLRVGSTIRQVPPLDGSSSTIGQVQP